MKKFTFTLLCFFLAAASLSAQKLNIFKSDGTIINVPLNSIDSITFSDEIPAASDILMNEIYSRGTADDPDWIEIYNKSDAPVDISGYKIYDIGGFSGSKPKKEFPAGSVVPAHGFYVIITDRTDDPSDFGLSANGEEVWFEDASGTIIDNVTFAYMDVTQSYGRLPDGSANWQLLNIITKGGSNQNTLTATIVMNEIYSMGTNEDPDWIEIYNASPFDFDISGFKIYDDGGFNGTKPKKEFPEGTIIPANGFFVIVTDKTGDPSDFGLSKNGEEVWLEDAAGEVIDNVTFPALTEDQSYGRFPDGTEDWQILNTVTKGAPNSNVTPSVLFMNEVFSRGTVEDPDWIEIYNSSSGDIDLTGYKIYDVGGYSGTKPKKEFPDGTIIPANGFYVIIVDDDDPSGFGLGKNGEEIWLEDPNGVVIDNYIFQAMEETQSYGRQPDGTANFFIFIEITKGSSNNNAGTLGK